MDFYQKVDISKPSVIMQDQMILQILDEVNNKFKELDYHNVLQHCF